MFQTRKEVYVNKDEMNEHLTYCKKYRLIINGPKPKGQTFGIRAYLEDGMVKVKLSYKKGTQACTYIFRKDTEKDLQETNGMIAYRTLVRYYKVPDLRNNNYYRKALGFNEESGKFLLSAPIHYYMNPLYQGIRIEAVGYDINSSYSSAMLNEMPDTSVNSRQGYVKADEIGFRENSDGKLVPVFEGHYAMWVFPKMPSPFTKFVETWYGKKKNAKTPEEKEKAKETLNFCVGYLQKVNPFLRATILYHANKVVEDLQDENTLYSNTDSIVSLIPRDDIKVGTNIGEFKVEHDGSFAYVGFNYQWDYERPSYRGIPKSWFPEHYDILTDGIPSNGNIYELKDYKIVRRNYEG